MSAVRLLAIDSSTETLSLAVCSGDREAFHTGLAGAHSSAELMPQAMALLASLQLPLSALDAVAFGCGPGAFTGLRAAAAVAQGLAFGLQCPVIPVDSLMLVAEAALQPTGPLRAADLPEVGVVMDARMGEVYAARYRCGPSREWQVLQAPGLWAPADLALSWAALGPFPCVGTGVGLLGNLLCPAPSGVLAGGDQRADAPDPSTHRSVALLALARRNWAQGRHLPAHEALPVYLRDKVALTTAERATRRASLEGQAATLPPAA